MISAGETIPDVPVQLVNADGIQDAGSLAVLGAGRVVFFTVPGAFTQTCHVNHLPGYVSNAEKFKARGVSRIVCGAVNDGAVLKAWAEATDALDRIEFIADGDAKLASALGLAKHFGGMGQRFRRSAMLINDGVVESVFVEEQGGVTGSGASAILVALEASNS